MAALDDTKLEAIVSQQIQLAKSHDSRERETDRAKALDYYLGKMDKYVPPEVNRSKVVSRDVADTMGWMLPGIIRVFTASDKMAVAEPVEEQDVQFAREATDGLNYVFWKDNKGYEVVYAATWDALLVGNGVVKTYYDDTPIYTTSFHSGLYEDQLAQLLEEDEHGDAPEILASTEKTKIIVDPETGMEQQVPCYDIKIKRKKADGKFIVEAIPPEQFLIHEDAVCTDDAAFTAHWERKMRTDLVAMGYDKDTVYEVPEAGRNETPEEQSRRETVAPTDASDKSTQMVDYYECFIRIDVDDDGEAELVRVCFAGNENGKMLHWEVWEDENPFDDIPCEPIPHRWTARSIADETMDVQDIKTVLARQGLNNLYATNSPQRFVTGKIDNMDELTNPTFGGVVVGGMGATVTDLVVPFVANHVFEAMAQQDEVIQRRTGVSRQGMALDPETLQNQTATASQQQHDASYSQVEQIARNMAEWGWSKVFRKLLKLLIKHQGPRSLMVNGKPLHIDPRFWNADMDVTINVGLGTGSRDRDLMHLQGILQTQILMADRFMAAGAVEDAIDMLPKILRTMTKMAESAGIRNPEDFYPEYTQDKIAALKQMAQERAAQPDPQIQAQMQIEQGKVQAQMQMKQADLEMDGMRLEKEAQAAAVREAAQMEADLTTKAADREKEILLEDKRQQFEAMKLAEDSRQKDLDRQQQFQLEVMKLNAQAQQADKAASGSREIEMAKIGAKEKDGKIFSKEDRMSEVLERMTKPKRIVRDPQTGRAVGVETVEN